MRALIAAIAFSIFASSAAVARSQIIVLPPDYAGAKETLAGLIGEAALTLGPTDRLIIFAARPVRQLADIRLPSGPNAGNRAWVKRKLAERAAPALNYIAELPEASTTEPPGNLMLPDLLGELARNVIPALPNKEADILLVGSLLYFDARDDRWSMTDRFYPSDGLLAADAAKVPYGVSGLRDRLRGVTIHFCSPGGKEQFVSNEHEAAVKRITALWVTEQAGRVGTFSDDMAT